MSAVIRLWGAGLGLIIEYASGVRYSNQACGVACTQPELEGVFVPFDAEKACLRIAAHFEGRKYRGSGAMRGLDEADADLIEMILRDERIEGDLIVNRARLTDSCEAWVHVLVRGESGPVQEQLGSLSLFQGFAPYPRAGILTWPNSD